MVWRRRYAVIASRRWCSIPNFNNPLGGLMPEENRVALLELAGKRRIPIIEDDIYGDLYFEDQRPRCLKALDREGLVLLCGSFSKTLAPGFRIGYIAPGPWYDKIVHLKTATNLGGASLPALAVAEFLRNGVTIIICARSGGLIGIRCKRPGKRWRRRFRNR